MSSRTPPPATAALSAWLDRAKRAYGTSTWRAGRLAPRTTRTACSMPSWIISPIATIVVKDEVGLRGFCHRSALVGRAKAHRAEARYWHGRSRGFAHAV